jgi:predicted membrane protein
MYAPWARAVSLTAGLALSALLMLYPYALGTTMTPMLHTALPLMLIGVSGALVHGFGFRPHNRALKVLFSPIVAWPLIGVGIALLALG